MTAKRAFGERLKAAREAADLTQVELGEALSVRQETVSNWESGVKEPSIDTLIQISRTLGVSTGWLVAGESPEGVDDGIRKALIGVRAVVDEMLSDLRKDRDKLYGELAMAGTVKRAEEPPLEEVEEIDVEPPSPVTARRRRR